MVRLTPPLVLVAEDDADVRAVVATALRKDGLSVVEAVDGADLVEHIGAALIFGNVFGQLDPIALVISDVRMPGRSGLEILAQLRRSEIGVGVILMTAHADAETRAEAERLGADAMVAKPFCVEDLLRVVNTILGDARTPTPTEAAS
jgi:CheY-like chemotaxis protein